MCVQPLNIINPTTSYNEKITPAFVTVPCGECPSCAKRYQDDWAVRTFYEIQNANYNGFSCQCVLTYDNNNLPTVVIDGFILPIFEHGLVKKLLRSLVKRLSRSFDYVGMRYLVAEEFGSDDNKTNRQHYHLLLCFPDVPRDRFGNHLFSYKDIYYWIRAYWYGFDSRLPKKIAFPYPDFCNHSKKISNKSKNYINFSHHKGLVLPMVEELSVRCPVDVYGKFSMYICKYVTKDFQYLHNDLVCKYLGVTPDNPFVLIDGREVHYRKTDRYKDIKQYVPKHFQSMSWGCPYFDSDEFINKDFDFELLQKVRVSFLCKSFPTPRYFINKLCYKNEFEGLVNYNGNKIYRRKLTDFGRDYMRWLKYNEIDQMTKLYTDTLSINGLSNITSDYLLSQNSYAKGLNLKNIYDVFDYCHTLLDGLSFRNLAIYKSLYRFVKLDNLSVSKMFNEGFISDFIDRKINNDDDYKYSFAYKVVDYENVSADLFSGETLLSPVGFKYAKFSSVCNYVKAKNIHIAYSHLQNYEDVIYLLDNLRLQFNLNCIFTKSSEDERINKITDKFNRPKNYGV